MNLFELFDKYWTIFFRGVCYTYLFSIFILIMRIIIQKKDYSESENSFGELDLYVNLLMPFILVIFTQTKREAILSLICLVLFVIYLFCVCLYTKKYRPLLFILMFFYSAFLLFTYIRGWKSHEAFTIQSVFQDFVSNTNGNACYLLSIWQQI